MAPAVGKGGRLVVFAHRFLMNFTRHPLLGLALGSALAVAGYVAGRVSVRDASSSGVGAVRMAEQSAKLSSSAAPGAVEIDLKADWAAQWLRIAAQPHSSAADEAAAEMLEKLAVRDAARALELALKERHRGRRSVWLQAVLRGWASVAPAEASAYVARLSADEREGAEAAVMDGAVKTPSAAIALAQQLVAADPARARSPANQLLRVLGHRGEFEAAVDFAAQLPEQIRSEMLGTAYQYWALAQPERAFDVALKLPAGDVRKVALDAAVSGWSQGDPSGLAEFALNISSPSDRTEALQTALREWVNVNPKAASEWIDKFDPKPEFDAGAAAVALHPDVLTRHPEIAASWAESITDPDIRSKTLVDVIKEWAARDAAAALVHANSSTLLKPADREALLSEIVASRSAP